MDSVQITIDLAQKLNVSHSTVREHFKRTRKTCEDGILLPRKLSSQNRTQPSTVRGSLLNRNAKFSFQIALLQVIRNWFRMSTDNEKENSYLKMRNQCQQQNEDSMQKNTLALRLLEYKMFRQLRSTIKIINYEVLERSLITKYQKDQLLFNNEQIINYSVLERSSIAKCWKNH